MEKNPSVATAAAPPIAPPLLASIVAVCSIRPAIASLNHVTQWIDACLDPSTRFTIEAAVVRGSPRLIERVLFLHQKNTTADEFVREIRLRRGLQAAVKRGDTMTVQLLHHYHRGYLAADALELAAERGDMQLFDWLYVHRPQERGCLPRAFITAAMNGRLKILQYLLELPPGHQNDDSAAVAVCPSAALRSAIEHGHCEVAQYLLDQGIRANLSALDNEVARHGHLEMVRWLHLTGLPGVFTTAAMDAASKMGHFDVVRFLHEQRKEGCRSWAMDGAATGGYLELVEFLYMNRIEGCTARAVNGAARNGHLNVLQWLFDNLPRSTPIWTTEAVTNALAHGHYHVLAWLQTLFPELCAKIPPYSALEIAKEGNLHSLQLLHVIHGPDVRWSPRVMDVAAASGDLEMVQWLLENRPNDGTGTAMDRAAEAGYLHVLKWLHDHGLACTHWAMDKAAGGGYLDVVQWLHENRLEGCSMDAMTSAAANGHLNVIKWFHENRTEGATTGAMDAAAIGGHLEIVVWLHENRSEGCSSEAIDRAAALGNYEVVQWLLYNYPSIACSPNGLRNTATRGRLRILKLLQSHFNMPVDAHGIFAAARNGYLDVVQWALEDQHIEQEDPLQWSLLTALQCRAEAEQHGQFHIVNWLDTRNR